MKNLLTFIIGFSCVFVNAQNRTDVLRYSVDNTQGTARFQSMSGAFGALGGDLSAINVNPAGSAVFKNGTFSVSGTSYQKENKSTYFNSRNLTEENSLDINQVGAVFILNSAGNSNWKKIALAVNYDVTSNFENEIFSSGTSTQGIDNYFLDFAQGTPYGSILLQDGEFLENAYLDIGASQNFGDQQTFLGDIGGIIDPLNEENNNTQYLSNSQYNTVNQELLKNTIGYNSKLTLNMASQYQENIFIGASLNVHNIIYEEYKEFTETGYDTTSEIQTTIFDNFLRTEGSGVSLNIGAIAKLNNFVRVGASYQSPTWYQLTDEFSQRIDSDLADNDIDFINFNVINFFDYSIKTPSKVTGSLAFIFGKQGLLSLDYSHQDMSSAKLKPTNDINFEIENDNISTNLAAVSTLKIGGEYRISRVSLRAGYRYEQSPYINNNLAGDLTGYSAGIGYDFGRSRLDFAINQTEQETSTFLFDTGLTTPAIINRIQSNATLSYSLSF